jgi:hypothetical protein
MLLFQFDVFLFVELDALQCVPDREFAPKADRSYQKNRPSPKTFNLQPATFNYLM